MACEGGGRANLGVRAGNLCRGLMGSGLGA